MTQRHLRLVPRASRFADLDPETLTPAEGDALIELALRVLAQRHRRGAALTSPSDTQAYLRLWLAGRPQEVFACLFLDTKHRVIACEELFQGTIDGASVHPREVVRRAIETQSAALIMVHNHPSGRAEPSQADLRITQRLVQALNLLDIRVLDHVVVAAEGSVSLAERGLI
jgi:DNA repair protein RadC